MTREKETEITETELRTLLNQRFNGVLLKGSHQANGEACALELLSVAKNIEWTDEPITTNTFDIRAINDIDVQNDVRTELMLPLIAAYQNSRSWSVLRQQQVVQRIVIDTVREIIGTLPSLPETVQKQCQDVKTLSEARAAANAAYAAADAAARDAAYAANAAYAAAAAAAARDAARAAAYAANAAYAAAAAAAARDAAYAAADADAAARAAAYAAAYADADAAAAAAARETIFRTAVALWLRAVRD